ncbi:hypothetical protein ACX12E_22990 [Paenibacillus vandeheii]
MSMYTCKEELVLVRSAYDKILKMMHPSGRSRMYDPGFLKQVAKSVNSGYTVHINEDQVEDVLRCAERLMSDKDT